MKFAEWADACRRSGLPLLVLLSMFGAPPKVFASKYTMLPGATDWESPDSYDNGGGKPSAGDTVEIPSGVAAVIDDDSIAFVSNLGKIYMPSPNGSLVIDISTNAVLGCLVSGLEDVSKEVITTNIGRVLKRGEGELYLAVGATSSSYLSPYYVNWDILEGSLRMPTNSAAATSRLYFGAITVDEGATLYTARPGRTRITELWGGGLVTNEEESATYYLDVYGFDRKNPCEFSGVIGGGIALYSRGNVNLTGTNSTYRGDTWSYYYNSYRSRGITGLRRFGKAGEPSSAGVGGQFRTREDSGSFLYLGDGETTDRSFLFDESTSRPCEVDAGAVGGVTFTGWWGERTSGGSDKNQQLVITGSNTVECVLANEFKARSSYTTRITKKGSGTWRLAHHDSRKNTGVVAVQDGTLKFDSIAEKGTVCSLGLSTLLYADYSGALDEERKVGYALMIGGDPEKVGTLEYSGADSAVCTTRPLEVSGKGVLRISGGEFVLGGVSAGAEGATLVFDAANGKTNKLANVVDGKGPFSLEKIGSGVLELGGEQSWSGTLDVREGEVLVDSHYDYWRFVMKENAYGCTNRYDVSNVKKDDSSGKRIFGVSEFALYSGDGERQNSSMSIMGESSDSQDPRDVSAAELPPGYAAFENGSSLRYYLNNGSGRLDNLFDGSLGSGNGAGLVAYVRDGIPYLDKPSRYGKVIMRLQDGAKEVRYFDIGNSRAPNTDYFGRCLTAYALEGSADGIFWEKVAEDDAAVIPGRAADWYGDNTNHTTLAVNRLTPFANVSSVRVRSGARLVANGPVSPIRKLVLDAEGAGAIDGFEFAEGGEIEIAALPEGGSFSVSIDVKNSASFGNVLEWNVTSGGRKRNLKIRQTSQGLDFARPGLKIFVK